MSASQRAGATQRAGTVKIKRRHIPHPRGSLHENTIVSRIPEGMPLKERPDVNYYSGHRPGSFIRTAKQRFLQKGRQLERRNPSQAALKLAPSRPYENEPTNISVSRKIGWTEANNVMHYPIHGHWGSVGYPMGQANPVVSEIPQEEERPPLSESYLYEGWQPVEREVRRPMTLAEMQKEERFRQTTAEQLQRKAKGALASRGLLYRSPRSISRNRRKVKSLSRKSKLKSKLKSRKYKSL